MITREQIIHLAKLARLKLNDEEIEKLREDLSKILNYVEKINELKLEDIEPLINIIEELKTREDEPAKSESNQLIIENFPEKEDNYLKVPKIIEK